MQSAKKFYRSIGLLQEIVAAIDPYGRWKGGENHWQFQSSTGGVLNWWESTGTLDYQGDPLGAAELKATFEQELARRLKSKVRKHSRCQAKRNRRA